MAPKANQGHKKTKEKRKFDELHPCRDMTPPQAVREIIQHIGPASRPVFHDACQDACLETCRTMHDRVGQMLEELLQESETIEGSLDVLRADERNQGR